jgi:hypothetical protein
VLGNPVVLRCVWSGDFMLSTFLLQETLGVCPNVLTSSVGAKDFHAVPGLKLSLGDERFKVLRDFGLLP